MLWAWMLRGPATASPRSTSYFAAPDHRNAASLRVLAKVGFEQGAVVRRAAADGTVDHGGRLHVSTYAASWAEWHP